MAVLKEVSQTVSHSLIRGSSETTRGHKCNMHSLQHQLYFLQCNKLFFKKQIFHLKMKKEKEKLLRKIK